MNKKKILKLIPKILLAFIIYIFCGAVIYYIPHKDVSDEFITEFEKKYYSSSAANTVNERVMCVDDNTDALIIRLKMIEAAKEEIILSTFDFIADESGQDIMAALLCAADRGVDVKIIVDGLTSMLRMSNNEYFAAIASHQNISIKRYNTLNLFTPWKLQARLHDKYLIVDDTMYLLGGRNTYNLFLGDYQRSKNHDREVFVYSEGSNKQSLNELKDYFDDIWHLDCNTDYDFNVSRKKRSEAINSLYSRYNSLKKLYPEAFAYTDWEHETYETNKITLFYNPIVPYNKAPNLWYCLNRIMLDGDFITIITPYIICSDDMYDDLEKLVSSSSSVNIITNAVENGANPTGCCDYINNSQNILASGVKVYEYCGDHSTHIKTILVDDNISIIGSLNFDMRSVYIDTEMMLVIDCPELNSYLKENAFQMMASSKTLNSDGTYDYGENFVYKELSSKKKNIYSVLKYLIRPFRYLL